MSHLTCPGVLIAFCELLRIGDSEPFEMLN